VPGDIIPEALKPSKLICELFGVTIPALRDVGIENEDVPQLDRDQPVFIGGPTVVQTMEDMVRFSQGGDGHAVILTAAPEGDVIALIDKFLDRKLGVFDFGFLHAEDIGTVCSEPRDDDVQA
jgi:hypothetical protein